MGFQQQQEYKKLTKKAADLEQQIKVYNTLKDEQLAKSSTDDEREVYEKLMGKLSLLQEEAKDEKDALRAKAKENEDKEFALNQYQKIVRNIINANVLAKAQIHHRDQVIVRKDVTIEEKKQKINEMEKLLSQNEEQIQQINRQLDQKIKELTEESNLSKSSKQLLNQKIAALRQASAEQVKTLEQKNQEVNHDLGQVKSLLAQTQSNLGQATSTIAKQETEKKSLAEQLSREKATYLDEMKRLKADHDERLAREKAQFEKNLKKQRLTAAAKSRKIAEFAAQVKKKAQNLEGQLSGLRNKVSEAEVKLAHTESQLGVAGKAVDDLKKQNKDIQSDLEKTRAIANARTKVAQEIQANFAKAGLKAAVDGKTGEVTIDFGEEYFDTGSSVLKPKMRLTLDKFIPIYARSLFNDPKVAEKIANVEIIGFASSTYKGKYVNPKSVKPADKEAIDYNLKLSFGRANAIFKHVLNKSTLSEKEQQKLFPIMKVVGRGYLPEGRGLAEIPDNLSEQEFCKRYNCQKAQRVVVKFNMKD